METTILFAPLIGSLIAGFGWKLIGETAGQWITTGLLFLSCLLSWIVFIGHDGTTQHIEIMRWIESGTLSTDWAIRLDRLTAIMLIVITTVSALVHLYSFGYMAHDENFTEDENYRARFFAYLSFFTFAMLMLVTADNLVQMFFGWEGVGLASYLLIGFYYKKPSANAAAIKAFVVNRVGDFGFALGIFALFFLTDSISFDVIFAAAPELAQTQLTFLWTEWNAAELIAVLLFIGAMGKSAQLFLHTWLPDAMEGPTPVSALIHAATMVTAGVFLVSRMSPLMEFAPIATGFIVFVGAATAFFAATVGLVQNDIKRVIAYSTCSQLGYMFVAAGVGVYSVAMFHLFTHAFFKAMLFLGAGSVIHAMHHEQDMRNYGGLRKKIPYTFAAMLIGTLAITGVGIPLTQIGFAGFLSKDAVIESAWAGGTGFAFWALVLAAFMTSFYSWRLMFMTFFGKPRGDKHTHEHAHESPMTMLVPLGVLSLGAIFAGMIWYQPFFGDEQEVEVFFGITEAGTAAEETEHAALGFALVAAAAAQTVDDSDIETEGDAVIIEGENGVVVIEDEQTVPSAPVAGEEPGADVTDVQGTGATTAGEAETVETDADLDPLSQTDAAQDPAQPTTENDVEQQSIDQTPSASGSGDNTTGMDTETITDPSPVTGVQANELGTDEATDEPVSEADEAEAAEMTEPESAAEEASDHDAELPEGEIATGWTRGAIFMAEDNHVIDDAHHAPVWVKVSPFVAMLLGFALSWLMYIRRPELPAILAENQRPLYNFLLNKWYFDEIYDAVFVRPAMALGRLLWRRGDGSVIDGGINGLAMGVIPFFTRLAGRGQSGYLFHYAFAMVLGLLVLLTWMTLAGGSN